MALKIKTTGLNKLSPFHHDSGVYAIGLGYEPKMENMLATCPVQTECMFCTQYVNEKAFLEAFYAKLSEIHGSNPNPITWLTWNGVRFDVPYIMHRSLINGIPETVVHKWFPEFKNYIPFQKKGAIGPVIKELKPAFIPNDPDAGCNSLANVARSYGIVIDSDDSGVISYQMLADSDFQKNFDTKSMNIAVPALKHEVTSIFMLGGFAI